MPDPVVRGPRRLLAVLAMTNVDITIVNVAVQSIRADLGASGAQLELVVGGYVLAYAMLPITGARLGRMRGYRRVFVVGLGAFTLTAVFCGVAPGPLSLIVARVVQGAAAALMAPQVLTGIQLNSSGAARARALALYAAALAARPCGASDLGRDDHSRVPPGHAVSDPPPVEREDSLRPWTALAITSRSPVAAPRLARPSAAAQTGNARPSQPGSLSVPDCAHEAATSECLRASTAGSRRSADRARVRE
jgi:hypothetical protein